MYGWMRWLKSFTYCNCSGYNYQTANGTDYDCYANFDDNRFEGCGDCLAHRDSKGIFNPDTGKRDYIRWFIINRKEHIPYLKEKLRNFFMKKTCGNCAGYKLDYFGQTICICSYKETKADNKKCKTWSKKWFEEEKK